jgi:3-methyl-2-oxobutanoate hydroxymethyltransferase
MTDKITTTRLKKMKEEGRKITALTCYSYSMAMIMKEADIDVILVGDSVGMVELGYEDTLPVTIDEMVHHTKAVKRAEPNALIVTDMPFMSYNIDKNETFRAAGKLLKEGGAQAVKLEGGKIVAETIRFLVDNNIPVMGHLGLTPQAVHKMGGYKVQGTDPQRAEEILNEAKMLEEAGVFAIVLEGMPAALSKKITEQLFVPTISCGAGPFCDGQILVLNDMLGMNIKFKPKFIRRYALLEDVISKAFKQYVKDVREGEFPSSEECY